MNNGSGMLVDSIFVSADKTFDGKRWREAILYYLFGVWGDREEVMRCPKLTFFNFGKTSLILNTGTHQYYAFGSSDSYWTMPPMIGRDVLMVNCEDCEMELGLIRFVKNNQIRKLGIRLDGSNIVWLCKGRSKSGLLLAIEHT